MKTILRILMLAFVTAIVLPAQASRDTLWVEVDDILINEVIKQVIDDDAGAHIIGLRRGGTYYFNGLIANNYHLEIVGEAGPADIAPAMLMRATDAGGSSPDFLFEPTGDVTLKNVYLPGIDDMGNYRNLLNANQPEVRLVIENCVFNYANSWKALLRFASTNGTAILQNNIVMNMMREDGYVWATWFHTQNTKLDTLVVTNNTIFNCPNNMLSINEHQDLTPNYALVEHNTVINTAKDIMHFSYWVNMETKNNLFFNPMVSGDAVVSLEGWTDRVQCPDNEPYAFMKVDTIDNTLFLDSILNLVGLTDRKVEITNNNFYQTPAVAAFTTTLPDSVEGYQAQLLSPRSQAMFDNNSDWPGLVFDYNTTYQIDPVFTLNPTDEAKVLDHSLMLYTARDNKVNFNYDPDGNPLTFEWPLDFIDFTYSDATLATASDLGYHLGDLFHWYPEEYARWKQGIATSKKDIAAYNSLLKVYPNPAANNIINLNMVSDVIIYNISGQLMLSVQKTDRIDITSLKNGLYFLKSNEGSVVKFVKQ